MRVANGRPARRSGIRFAFYALLAAASAASAADPLSEWFQRLDEHAASYERHTNAEMQDSVFAGIHSDNEAVVRHAVETVYWETMMDLLRRGPIRQAIDRKDAERTAALREDLHQTPDFAAVPGLRDFLLDYVRQGVAKDGWQAAVTNDENTLARPVWASMPTAFSTAGTPPRSRIR